MKLDDLVRYYPRLYHMSEAGSWQAIQALGLKTTAQLVAECDPGEEIAQQVLSLRRSHSVSMTHPTAGNVIIRDQGPLKLHNLLKCLTDVNVEQWLTLLNSRVFFWLDERRLNGLLGAKNYRRVEHDVLVLDTRRLVQAHLAKTRVSAMNTGATIFPNSLPRGSDTFMTIEDFPFEARRKGRAIQDVAVELSVLDGVPDVADFILEVQRREGAAVKSTIYQP